MSAWRIDTADARAAWLAVVVAVIMAACVALWPAPVMASGAADPAVTATQEGAAFGIDGFERNAKGTARAMDGQPAGYRFPLLDDSNVVVVRTPANVLVHVDADAAQAAGFDCEDADDQAALRRMLCDLDAAHSMGGAVLSDVEDPWLFTVEPDYVQAPYRYRFCVAGEDGDAYAVVDAAGQADAADAAAAADDIDLGDGALWSDDARLVAADQVSLAAESTWLEGLGAFFARIDYRPLWVSIKTAGVALAVSFALGLLAAWRTMGTTSRIKGVLDSVFTIPMVLPPTVCGFLLLMVFGQSTAVGRWLIDHGVSLVFTWSAAVISAIVVSFPLVYRTALGAFEALDSQMLDAARTLGWSEWRIFHSLMLPLGWPSIAAGTVLAFARAMGEFGCTLFFAGNYAGITQTIPIAIYFEWMGGDTDVALFWVLVVIAFSFLVILFINLYTARSQAYRSLGYIKGRAAADALHVGSRVQGVQDAAFLDDDEAAGGDALRIDRDALRELMRTDAAAGAAVGAPTGAVSTGRGSSSPSSATRDGKGGR